MPPPRSAADPRPPPTRWNGWASGSVARVAGGPGDQVLRGLSNLPPDARHHLPSADSLEWADQVERYIFLIEDLLYDFVLRRSTDFTVPATIERTAIFCRRKAVPSSLVAEADVSPASDGNVLDVAS